MIATTVARAARPRLLRNRSSGRCGQKRSVSTPLGMTNTRSAGQPSRSIKCLRVRPRDGDKPVRYRRQQPVLPLHVIRMAGRVNRAQDHRHPPARLPTAPKTSDRRRSPRSRRRQFAVNASNASTGPARQCHTCAKSVRHGWALRAPSSDPACRAISSSRSRRKSRPIHAANQIHQQGLVVPHAHAGQDKHHAQRPAIVQWRQCRLLPAAVEYLGPHRSYLVVPV